uniref:Uncharacterized protein n=1 Tax=Tetradesmus obliquus TaxID=3088 RepID=A0A383V7R1_TETOB
MVAGAAMCSRSSAAWLQAWPLLLLLLLCSQAGLAAARPQAQDVTERLQKQQVQQAQQAQQGQQGQQGQQFFPLLALIGTRWFSEMSRQQQQRQQQQQQQTVTRTTTTTTTTTTPSVSTAAPAAAAPAQVGYVQGAGAPAPLSSTFTASKPAVPAGDVIILDTAAATAAADTAAATAAADTAAATAAAAPNIAAPATLVTAAPAPAVVATDMPDTQQQQQQQQQQQPPAAVDLTAVMVPGQGSSSSQPDATAEGEPVVAEVVCDDDGEDCLEYYDAEAPSPAPAAAPVPALPPQAGGRTASAAGPRGAPGPQRASAAKVQRPGVMAEAGPTNRPVAIPVRPLPSRVPSNNGQQPRRRRRRQPALPAVAPAIMPLTEVLPKQQVQLQGQKEGA